MAERIGETWSDRWHMIRAKRLSETGWMDEFVELCLNPEKRSFFALWELAYAFKLAGLSALGLEEEWQRLASLFPHDQLPLYLQTFDLFRGDASQWAHPVFFGPYVALLDKATESKYRRKAMAGIAMMNVFAEWSARHGGPSAPGSAVRGVSPEFRPTHDYVRRLIFSTGDAIKARALVRLLEKTPLGDVTSILQLPVAARPLDQAVSRNRAAKRFIAILEALNTPVLEKVSQRYEQSRASSDPKDYAGFLGARWPYREDLFIVPEHGDDYSTLTGRLTIAGDVLSFKEQGPLLREFLEHRRAEDVAIRNPYRRLLRDLGRVLGVFAMVAVLGFSATPTPAAGGATASDLVFYALIGTFVASGVLRLAGPVIDAVRTKCDRIGTLNVMGVPILEAAVSAGGMAMLLVSLGTSAAALLPVVHSPLVAAMHVIASVAALHLLEGLLIPPTPLFTRFGWRPASGQRRWLAIALLAALAGAWATIAGISFSIGAVTVAGAIGVEATTVSESRRLLAAVVKRNIGRKGLAPVVFTKGRMISCDGPSGGGKTTLAKMLETLPGERDKDAEVYIELDDLLKPPLYRHAIEKKVAGKFLSAEEITAVPWNVLERIKPDLYFEEENSWDEEAITRLLSAIRAFLDSAGPADEARYFPVDAWVRTPEGYVREQKVYRLRRASVVFVVGKYANREIWKDFYDDRLRILDAPDTVEEQFMDRSAPKTEEALETRWLWHRRALIPSWIAYHQRTKGWLTVRIHLDGRSAEEHDEVWSFHNYPANAGRLLSQIPRRVTFETHRSPSESVTLSAVTLGEALRLLCAAIPGLAVELFADEREAAPRKLQGWVRIWFEETQELFDPGKWVAWPALLLRQGARLRLGDADFQREARSIPLPDSPALSFALSAAIDGIAPAMVRLFHPGRVIMGRFERSGGESHLALAGPPTAARPKPSSRRTGSSA